MIVVIHVKARMKRIVIGLNPDLGHPDILVRTWATSAKAPIFPLQEPARTIMKEIFKL